MSIDRHTNQERSHKVLSKVHVLRNKMKYIWKHGVFFSKTTPINESFKAAMNQRWLDEGDYSVCWRVFIICYSLVFIFRLIDVTANA